METGFKCYDPDQIFLLPPSMRDWLPEDHLVWFVSEVVDQLDIGQIMSSYNQDKGGQPPYNPAMMVKLLIYAYCVGVPSSRRIEKNT